MKKQKLAQLPLQGSVGGSTMIEDRYYVQRLTEQIFLIRERVSVDGEPGPDDRIVRSFSVSRDAYLNAGSLNERQRELDELYGHWVQHAI